MNIEYIKKDLLRILDGVNKEKLSLSDLKTYAEIVKIVSEIQEKGYAEKLAEVMSNMATGFNGPKAPTVSELK